MIINVVNPFFYFFVFVFGTLVGSFLNVVILRFNTGQPILTLGTKRTNSYFEVNRSKCFCCGKALFWWELIPIISFLFLRGRCSGCKAKISWQYLIVEFLTGMALVLIYLKVSEVPDSTSAVSLITFHFLIWCTLIVITFYDLHHKIIPDFFVYFFIIISAVFNFFSHSSFLSLDFWAGPIFFAAFAGLWLVSGGRWLGFGDAKLVLGIGFLLGWLGGLSALVLSFWIGAIFGLAMIGLGRISWLPHSISHLTMKSEIPFAPFLILGTAIVFFGGVMVF